MNVYSCNDCLMYNDSWGCFWIYLDDKGILKLGKSNYVNQLIINELIDEINKPIMTFGLEAVYDSFMKISKIRLLLYHLLKGDY